jgi:hypothetical protein
VRRLPAFVVLLAPSLLAAGWIDADIEAPLVLSEGGEAELAAIAPDGSSLAWELDEDGLFDDGEQARPMFSARGIDGPAERYVALRVESEDEVAYRLAEIQIANVPPTIVSEPPAVARRGLTWEYPVGAEDPGEDDAFSLYIHLSDRVGPERMVVTDEGIVRWRPTSKDIGFHLVRVLVEDHDGAVTAQNFLLEVVDDTAPFSPNPTPMPAECFRSLQPRITVGNTNDADGDPVLTFFEVSEDGDFEGTDVVASPGIPPGRDGFTRWTVSRPLDPGGIYYWRAWATDGLERSPEIRGALCIQLDDEEPPRERPPTHEWILPDGPEESDVHYGCTAAGGSPSALAPLVFFAFLRRRR